MSWTREPWPWLLMAGPATVLVAGAATTWIAIASHDGVVAEDYYKQGLSINRLLAREDAARRLGISGDVELAPGRLKVALQGDAPEALFAHLAHATRAGNDQRLRLRRVEGATTYEAELPPLPAGRWRIVIEDPRGRWRLAREAP